MPFWRAMRWLSLCGKARLRAQHRLPASLARSKVIPCNIDVVFIDL
jgi:hypothetical protein